MQHRVTRIMLAIGLALLASGVSAADFATCILEKMPGSSNGATNSAVFQTCISEHPGGYVNVKQGAGRGLFGFKDGNACTIDIAKQTSFQPSAGAIAIACRCLYNKAFLPDQTCANPFD